MMDWIREEHGSTYEDCLISFVDRDGESGVEPALWWDDDWWLQGGEYRNATAAEMGFTVLGWMPYPEPLEE